MCWFAPAYIIKERLHVAQTLSVRQLCEQDSIPATRFGQMPTLRGLSHHNAAGTRSPAYGRYWFASMAYSSPASSRSRMPIKASETGTIGTWPGGAVGTPSISDSAGPVMGPAAPKETQRPQLGR